MQKNGCRFPRQPFVWLKTDHSMRPFSITREDIEKRRFRARSYRNRRIGDFLKELRLIEGRNTGFPTAYRALEENGSGELGFDTDETRGYLSVTIPVHPNFLPKATGGDAKAAAYTDALLDALENEDLTLTQLAHALGYRSISKKLSDTVNALVVQGRIERIPAATGSTILLHATEGISHE